ncbi:MAG: DUF917 domain-containing protein [Peptococcaceae bacterium]|nr:DUF917 domain-containing protein [Peptococcaceae bacterium]
MNGIKTMEQLEDFVRGATLLGTGGGGSQKMGKDLLMASFQEKKEISWISIDDMDEEDWVCTAFYMGSIAPLSDEDKEQMKRLGLKERSVKRVLVAAVQELEKELGIHVSGLIPVEMGGLNSAAPLDAAAQMGKAIIDADLAGRAVPEVAQTLPRLNRVPICPIACCDAWGNVSLIRKTHGYDMAEALGKMLSIPAYEPIGLACFAMRVKEARNTVVKGTLSRCAETGAAVRKACAQNRDPAEAFAQATHGKAVFRGRVERFTWESRGGYMYADSYIQGKHDFAGHRLHIWAKNENHISWLDDKPFITSPDLIQAVDAKTGEPITNTDMREGMEVAVVVIGNPLYRTPEGLDIMGPSHYGFDDIPYTPMEELVK